MKHDRHGYWLEEAGGVEPLPALSGERSADVVVIGGGYTGMWAAWQLKALEPGVRVVLLEREVCGYGPSGRNGGFCNVMWFSLPNMRARWGDDAALAVARASSEAVAGIESFCREQEVDAWFRRGGYLQVSTAPAHDGTWDEPVAACRGLGESGAVEPLDAAGVAARCASPAFRGGAFYPDAATVQPARLAFGLRQRLLEAGVEIFERSPVRRLIGASDIHPVGVGPKSDAVRAETDGGAVKAGRAIVAVGGAARTARGPLRDALTVTSSHIVLTEPVPDVLEEIGWTGGECITDSRVLIDYFRTTPDGRIAFGWGGGRIAMGARLGGRAEVDPEVTAAAVERLYEYFPALREAGAGRSGPASITHSWGGPIDVSPTHLPIVVPLPGERAFAAAGYTGNGVGPAHMVGRVLASLALDRRDDPSRLPLVDPSPQRVPPEPFHWLGGEAIRLALNRKENAELAARRPDPISSLISRLPDLIGFHIGR
ncbi:MAG TPA: FAD-binding oxidoreductase [Solirubrobacterales bacterium]|nr:FAD-binding oxidoreductase [Solirubrobacterales bacterium]